MVGDGADDGSYPPDTNEVVSGYPYRMTRQESLARIAALQTGLDSLLNATTPETDATETADQRAFVHITSLCSTLLVRKFTEYADVVIPPNPNISLRIRTLQGLYGEIPDLRVQPELIDVNRDISRDQLAKAMRSCYEVQGGVYRAAPSVHQRMTKATVGLWDDLVRANPDGILLDAEADKWIQDMEINRRNAFGVDPGVARETS